MTHRRTSRVPSDAQCPLQADVLRFEEVLIGAIHRTGNRLRLAREDTAVHPEVRANLDEPHIGRQLVTEADLYDIARHEVLGGEMGRAAIAEDDDLGGEQVGDGCHGT